MIIDFFNGYTTSNFDPYNYPYNKIKFHKQLNVHNCLSTHPVSAKRKQFKGSSSISL